MLLPYFSRTLSSACSAERIRSVLLRSFIALSLLFPFGRVSRCASSIISSSEGCVDVVFCARKLLTLTPASRTGLKSRCGGCEVFVRSVVISCV